MGLHNENDGERQFLTDPDTGLVAPRETDTIILNRMDDDDFSNDIQEEEMNIDISFDDSSILWDLRQMFDPDFIVRDQSPFPRGDSADIPNEIMRVVTPVHGAGCPDENNMNAPEQTNQNNITEEDAIRSNICIQNLAHIIHNSDQVKDILFSCGPKEKLPRSNTQFFSDTRTLSETKKESPIQEVIKVVPRPVYNATQIPQRQRKYVSRRKKRYSSSSSSSSSDSSCSCSTKRRKRHNCRYKQQCLRQCNVATSNTNASNSNNTPSTFENQFHSIPPPYRPYVIPQNVWPQSYVNRAEIANTPTYQYTQNIPYTEPYYVPHDMSDIIERIHKLDLNIGHLTTGYSNVRNAQSDGFMSRY